MQLFSVFSDSAIAKAIDAIVEAQSTTDTVGPAISSHSYLISWPTIPARFLASTSLITRIQIASFTARSLASVAAAGVTLRSELVAAAAPCRSTTWFGGLIACGPRVSVCALATSFNTAAMRSTIDHSTRVVHMLAHCSGAPVVALARARDARAMRSTVVCVLTSTSNTEAEDQWQPGIIVQIDCTHHPQHSVARHELSGI